MAGILDEDDTEEAPAGLLDAPVPRRGTPAQSRALLAGRGELPRIEPSGMAMHPADFAALMLSPVPFAGGAVGFLNDMRQYATDPESRTPLNYGLTGLGLLPGGAWFGGMVKGAKGAGRTADALADAVKANRPSLPMDAASRMQRARDQGYLDKPLYHGTAADVPQFELSRAGTATGTEARREAIFLTDQPGVASDYADHAARVAQHDGRGGAANVMDLRARPSRSFQQDMAGTALSHRELQGAIEDVREKGGDALVLLNYLHKIEGTDPKVADLIAILDPALIRSPRAAFDPARLSDPNLLAALGGAGLLVAGSRSDAEDKP